MFSHSVMSDSLQPHGLQHARPPCPSPSPKFMFILSVMPSSHLILWCPLPFCPQSFPASGTFPKSCLFASDNQNTGVSASASALPGNIQGWAPLRLTGLISLQSKGLPGVFSSTTVQRHQFFGVLFSLQSSSHNCMWSLGKPYPWLWTFIGRVMSLLFNTLSRFVIAFLPRGHRLLIPLLQSLSAVFVEPKKRKSVTTSTFPPSICLEVMGQDARILVF